MGTSGTASGLRDIHIAVAAGHGGEDPGARSRDGRVKEKDVTLAIARAIAERLTRAPGYRAIMIRTGDDTVALDERPRIARAHGADLYLAIHADSYGGHVAHGVTVYARLDAATRWESARRAAAGSGSAAIADLAGDSAPTRNAVRSLRAGTSILAALAGVTTLRRDEVQAGNLLELRSPDIPSVLIETGYLSHSAEARRLANPAFQRRLADAIVSGVTSYFNAAPPPDTLLAWQAANGLYVHRQVVAWGDTLSSIARRFKVTVDALQALNGLDSDAIRVGQRLAIPLGGAPLPPLEYQVRPGDTLSELAARFGTETAVITVANGLDSDVIRVGQRLAIPLGGAPLPPIEYQVRPGDTLSELAARFGTDAAVITVANGLDSDVIRVGQRLLIPLGGAPLPPIEYQVRPGDTLSELAARFGTDAAAITAANGLDSDVIRVGQRLLIPFAGGPLPPIEYQVRAGDTLSELAARFGTDAAAITAANGLDSDVIRVGQRLLITPRRRHPP